MYEAINAQIKSSSITDHQKNRKTTKRNTQRVDGWMIKAS